jgi:hypothetical protein
MSKRQLLLAFYNSLIDRKTLSAWRLILTSERKLIKLTKVVQEEPSHRVKLCEIDYFFCLLIAYNASSFFIF